MESCHSLCLSTAGCTRFVYSTDERSVEYARNCYLKSTPLGEAPMYQDGVGVISGLAYCQGDPCLGR